MGEDALTHGRSRVGPLACCSLPLLVVMGGWQEDPSWAGSGWWDDSTEGDDGDNNVGWQDPSWAQSGSGGKAHNSGWGSKSWGVHPGSPSQGQQWPMYWAPQSPPPPVAPPELVYQTEPLFTVQRPPGPPPVELLPGFIAGFQKATMRRTRRGANRAERQVLTGGKRMTTGAKMVATRRSCRKQ